MSPDASPSPERSFEEVSGIGGRPHFASLNSSLGEGDGNDFADMITGDYADKQSKVFDSKRRSEIEKSPSKRKA